MANDVIGQLLQIHNNPAADQHIHSPSSLLVLKLRVCHFLEVGGNVTPLFFGRLQSIDLIGWKQITKICIFSDQKPHRTHS